MGSTSRCTTSTAIHPARCSRVTCAVRTTNVRTWRPARLTTPASARSASAPTRWRTISCQLNRPWAHKVNFTPAETEKLLLSVAGMVARDRLARGVKLNHPEAVALLSTWVIERAREGALVSDLMEEGRTVLDREDVMQGVAELLSDVQVEATFPDGRKLVTIHNPII